MMKKTVKLGRNTVRRLSVVAATQVKGGVVSKAFKVEVEGATASK